MQVAPSRGTDSGHGSTSAFYQALSNDIVSLAKQSAEIQWWSDPSIRTRRGDSQPRQPAPTGRLQRDRPKPATLRSRAALPPSQIHHAPVTQQDTYQELKAPRKKSNSDNRGVVVSTRKPAHLADATSAPERAPEYRYTRPSSQPLASHRRREHHLRLGIGRPKASSHIQFQSRGPDKRPEYREEHKPDAGEAAHTCDENVQTSELHDQASSCRSESGDEKQSSHKVIADTMVEKQQKSCESVLPSHSEGMSSKHSNCSKTSEILAKSFDDVHESKSSLPKKTVDAEVQAEEISAPKLNNQDRKAKSPAPKARLAGVIDLQMILPSKLPASGFAATAENSVSYEGTEKAPSDQRFTGENAPPQILKEQSDSNIKQRMPHPQGQRGQSQMRPVLRGLLADVICEMQAPPHEPAEVSAGTEVGALWKSGLIRPSHEFLKEDAHGKSLGELPPPYEAEMSSPNSFPGQRHRMQSAQVARKQMSVQTEKLTVLDAPTDQANAGPSIDSQQALSQAHDRVGTNVKTLMQVQAQAQEHLQKLVATEARLEAHQDQVLQLTRSAQQHADDAQRRMSESFDKQVQGLQNGAVEVQKQLANVAHEELRRSSSNASQQLEQMVQGAMSTMESLRLAAAEVSEQIKSAAAAPTSAPNLPGSSAHQGGRSDASLPEMSSILKSLDHILGAAATRIDEQRGQDARPAEIPLALQDQQAIGTVLDSIRRLEVRLEAQAESMQRSQAEQHAAHMTAISAFRSQARPVVQVLPVAIPQAVAPKLPARTAPTPAVIPATPVVVATPLEKPKEDSVKKKTPTADASTQARSEPVPPQQEARAARFTQYLLHGIYPTQHQQGRLVQPQFTWPPSHNASRPTAGAQPAYAASSLSGTLTSSRLESASPGEASFISTSGMMSVGEVSFETSAGHPSVSDASVGEIPPRMTFMHGLKEASSGNEHAEQLAPVIAEPGELSSSYPSCDNSEGEAV